ncbi:MAG TPA: 2-C-methyl-D-erythritol 4-phosphate cytidylyltransferase [Vicinamibacterales bacterium]|nr:2-C-methyl-D-erythritol 4-phosphate cytidylyltransferase [Vicinamibacterales bacterium]
MHVSAIIAAGGRGSRFGGAQPKQFELLAGVPILKRTVDTFLTGYPFDEVVVALPSELAANPPAYLDDVIVVEGGERRQDSVANAFAAVAPSSQVIVIHDAARPLVSPSLIERTVAAAIEHGAAIAALAARDTVKRGDASRTIRGTLPRNEIFLAQTPQAFRVGVLRDALSLASTAADATDEATLAEQAGHHVHLVEGDVRNLKITTPDDLDMAERLLARKGGAAAIRIGNGYDLHRLVAGRPLVLGGVSIPFDKGLDGHSDADAVCHAVTDAILGAASAGDIGRHFPDTDPAWKGADSVDLLKRAVAIVKAAGFGVANVDVIVIAQRPKLSPYVDSMRASLACALGIDMDQVSVKGKTNEGVDSTGAGEAIAVHAVALIHHAS